MSKHSSAPTIWGREPVLWIGLAQALIAVGVGFGLDLSTEQVGMILAGVAAVLAFVARHPVTPNVSVVERRDDDKVVAGKANEKVAEGQVVRSLDEGPVHD